MWTKTDSKTPTIDPAPAAPAATAPTQPKKGDQTALIGPSLTVEGTIKGDEDLILQGVLNGTIDLKNNAVTVGATGRVQADIYARTITVDGEIIGNLYGSEKVTVHRSGNIKGNIVCARVTLEDGARIKGSIDTDAGGTSKAVPFRETPGMKEAESSAADRKNKPNGAIAA